MSPSAPTAAADITVDSAEIERFAALADEWWDPHGRMRPLHRLNPARLTYIRDRIAGHFGRDPLGRRPFAGLRVLDVGCGAGLVTEPVARLGADATGLDAADKTIDVARAHAAEGGLTIDYRCATTGELVAEGRLFDVVLALEIVEHVADTESFVAQCAALVRPGGLVIASTLNRTPQAFLLAVVGAEYVMRWLPRGTHDWRKFVRPSELAGKFRVADLAVTDLTGLTYSPLSDSWRTTGDLSVNYMACAVKGGAA